MSNADAAEKWLDHEDRICRDDRLERLKLIARIAPKGNYWLFCGGKTAKYLFEEARYCFVCGQFFAAILLGTAFVETTLADKFFAFARNDLRRASFSRLLEEVIRIGWISDAEYAQFTRVRILRNRVTHFREPSEKGTIIQDAAAQQTLPYEMLEDDARTVMAVAMRLLQSDIL